MYMLDTGAAAGRGKVLITSYTILTNEARASQNVDTSTYTKAAVEYVHVSVH